MLPHLPWSGYLSKRRRSKILQHRIENAREDSDWNVVNLYFVGVDQTGQLRKMKKLCSWGWFLSRRHLSRKANAILTTRNTWRKPQCTVDTSIYHDSTTRIVHANSGVTFIHMSICDITIQIALHLVDWFVFALLIFTLMYSMPFASTAAKACIMNYVLTAA